MTVTRTADMLYNRLLDMLRTHQNYLSIKGGRLAKAAAEYEVRGTHNALDQLHQKLDLYERAYELLQDDLVDWERELDDLRDMIEALTGKDAESHDIADVLDWVDRANALYRPKFRG